MAGPLGRRAVVSRARLEPGPTPPGRMRIIHNPGLSCGTGEHPCTQLALMALERYVTQGARVADVGTGSGILAIAALRLGAAFAVGIDPDRAALCGARENFLLNGLTPALVAGSAESLATGCADITVANIDGTVLLSIVDDLIRITRPGGWLILSGFPEAEAGASRELFPNAESFGIADWRCLVAKPS
ncbi:MAG: 50S ribosomal protein L11 methyltransferase [Acidobacteriaceae bacterium]|nr:50S ribosomal protein L11 methyltransferase [Acidobacteriaceae bacterium]